jgi:hypothetical protein
MKVGESGKFEGQLHLFVDDGGTREIVLAVKGSTKPSDKEPVKK